MNVFTGNGTWTKQSYVNNVYVEVWGAGGGGLLGNANNSMGGGGGGGYSAGITTVAGNVSVVVGAGGGNNANGSASTFTGGATLTGNGGTRPTTVTGGAGGTGANGTINLPGQAGGNGVAQDGAKSGFGGDSPMGGGGGQGAGGANASGANSATVPMNGGNGQVPGGGGGGGAENNGTAGTGAAGLVIVWALSGTNGSDFAEVYETKPGVEPGDVVAMSADSMEYDSEWGLQNIAILEKAKPDGRVVGVVSTAAAVVMGRTISETAENPQPIALAGRTPVKVSLENGPIKTGDLLGPSSIPGVAAKNEKAGMVIGAALEDYDPPQDGGIGRVMIFVQTEYSSGARTNRLLERAGFDPDNIPPELDIGRLMLAQALVEKRDITTETPLSEVFTDRVVAGSRDDFAARHHGHAGGERYRAGGPGREAAARSRRPIHHRARGRGDLVGDFWRRTAGGRRDGSAEYRCRWQRDLRRSRHSQDAPGGKHRRARVHRDRYPQYPERTRDQCRRSE